MEKTCGSHSHKYSIRTFHERIGKIQSIFESRRQILEDTQYRLHNFLQPIQIVLQQQAQAFENKLEKGHYQNERQNAFSETLGR